MLAWSCSDAGICFLLVCVVWCVMFGRGFVVSVLTRLRRPILLGNGGLVSRQFVWLDVGAVHVGDVGAGRLSAPGRPRKSSASRAREVDVVLLDGFSDAWHFHDLVGCGAGQVASGHRHVALGDVVKAFLSPCDCGKIDHVGDVCGMFRSRRRLVVGEFGVFSFSGQVRASSFLLCVGVCEVAVCSVGVFSGKPARLR